MKNDYKKLEKALSALKKPSLDEGIKGRIKSNIVQQIRVNEPIPATYSRLKDALHKLASTVKPESTVRARMKEVVLSSIERLSIKKSFFRNTLGNWQRAFASFFIVMFTFGAITFYIKDIPVTNAALKTVFNKVFGTVEVIRNGERIEAEKDMSLKQGDIVVTGEDGIAVIRYVDNSITRLSPESELKIHKLYQDVLDETKTEVEVELTQGRVWTQVVNTDSNEATFKVAANDITANAQVTTSFDIKHEDEDEGVTVSVFDNEIEVTVQDVEDQTQVIHEGYAVEINDTSELEVVTHSNGDAEDKLWVNVNTAEDKEYTEGMVVEESVIAEETVVEPVVTAVKAPVVEEEEVVEEPSEQDVATLAEVEVVEEPVIEEVTEEPVVEEPTETTPEEPTEPGSTRSLQRSPQ
ncbi:FecR domain-containing protein [Patescibacteria group bacterium]